MKQAENFEEEPEKGAFPEKHACKSLIINDKMRREIVPGQLDKMSRQQLFN